MDKHIKTLSTLAFLLAILIGCSSSIEKTVNNTSTENNKSAKLITQNGGIFIKPDIVIDKKVNKEEAKKIFDDLDYDQEIIGNGFINYSFKNIKRDSIRFEITISFYNEKFSGFQIFFTDIQQASKVIDVHWEEKSESSQIELYNAWLDNQIGIKREFGWGKIKSLTNGMMGITYISSRIKDNYPNEFYNSGW